jgi:hypothetical protein
MAKPTQSESGLSLDRRQLLTSVAVITTAGLAPIAESAGAANPAQAASAAKTWVSANEALNVCASTARKIEEVAERNRIREQAGLPLLSIPRELRRMKNVDHAAEFEEFAERHRQAVWEEVLAPVREARGEPNWHPSTFMEGLVFQAQVSKILHERFAPATSNKMRPSQGPDWGYQRLRKPYCKLKSGR